MWKLWIFFIVYLYSDFTQALTEAEMRVEFTKFVMKCMKDNPVDMNEVMALQKLITPKDIKTKCLLACAYKAEGAMNAKGLYDIEHAYKIAELAKNGDEKKAENGKKVADICAKVNEATVSDGEKGCERAAMIFKCVAETAPKALTEKEIKREFTKIVLKCLKTHPVDKSEVKSLQKLIPPTKMEVKCLLACAYRTEGTLNADGLFDIEHAYKVAEQAKHRVTEAKKVADICAKVNDEFVSDGSQGCERSGMIFKCLAEHAPKYGFHA